MCEILWPYLLLQIWTENQRLLVFVYFQMQSKKEYIFFHFLKWIALINLCSDVIFDQAFDCIVYRDGRFKSHNSWITAL